MPWKAGPSLLLAASLALALATGSATAQETPQRGGSAIFVLNQDPPDILPAVSSGFPNRMVGCILYQGLIQVSPDYKIMPLLAKSWTISADGLTYSFDLTKTEWHDGKPFTSEDVKYSIEEISAKHSPVFASAGKVIDAIEAPAPDRVVIKLKQSFGPFMISLACTQGGAIAPAHLYRGTDPMKNPATLEKPVGTGSFKLTEWKRGDHLRLERNDKYWEPGKPYLDEIVAKVITSPAAAMQALEAGEVDVVQVFGANEMERVRGNPKLKVEYSDVAPATTFAFLNMARKPLDDKRVRQALYMATDRAYLLKNAFFGLGSVATQPISTDISWVVDKSIDLGKLYPFDPAKANVLLDEAGQKRGADGKRFPLKLLIYTSEYPEYQQVAPALKSMWSQVGVDVTIEAMETSTLAKRVYIEGDFDVNLQSYTTFGDPALGTAREFVTSSLKRLYGNASGYSNPTVDELFQKGERATSFEERGKYYGEAQAIIAADAPMIALRHYRNIDAASKRLNGLWNTVQGNGYWAGAWLAK